MAKTDPIFVWQHLCFSLQNLIEIDPVLLPLIRRWADLYATSKSHTSAKSMVNQLFNQIPHRSIEKENIVIKEQDDIKQTCQVLFVPGFARINCLGVSQTIAQTLWQENPNFKLGIISPQKMEEGNLPELDERFIQCEFNEKKFSSFNSYFPAFRLAVKVRNSLKSDPHLECQWRRNGFLRILEIARYQENKERAKKFLEQMNTSLVICLNEQLWPGSALIPAAKELGIPTVQILHGTPTRLYWPFISDETWVWDDFTKNMFMEYGAPESKLVSVGNLEVVYWLENHNISKDKLRDESSDVRICLFLSQWVGSKVWGIDGFDEPVNWLAEALSKENEQWKVVVRLHPYDDIDARDGISNKLSFLGDRLSFTDHNTPLAEDIFNADIVCTGSSTAVLMALAFNKIGFLIWSPAMEYVHGQPFLDKSNVVYSGQELFQLMKGRFGENINLDYSIHKEANRKAAQRILQLIGQRDSH